MKSRLIVALLALAASGSAWAAVPRQGLPTDPRGFKGPQKAPRVATRDLDSAVMALRLPVDNRLQALKNQGEKGRAALIALVEDGERTLTVRWRAMLALGQLYPESARPLLERAAASPEWYMRNAAILAMAHGSRDAALEWAGRLLEDPALVVRTAAVQTIERLRGIEKEHLLWEKLDAEENFKNGKSLWVRKHIARTLSHFARPGQENRFVRLLQDADPRVHPYAVSALRKISGESVDKGADTLEDQRRAWLRWWSDRG